MRINRLTGIWVLSTIILLSACSIGPKAKPSGYLVRYKHLKPLNGDERTLYYEDTLAPWHNYTAIKFDEVIIKLAYDAKGKAVNPEDINRMRDYFRQALKKNACTRLKCTSKTGEGVILLRAAVVDIKPVNVAANIVSRGLFFVPIDFGEAAIEGELRDSVTGRQLTAIVDRKIGGAINPRDSYTTWGSVKDALDEWAIQLAKLIDKNIKGIEAPKTISNEEDTQ